MASRAIDQARGLVGMKANYAERLKELRAENARLKKLVGNQDLDIDMLKEISAGNF